MEDFWLQPGRVGILAKENVVGAKLLRLRFPEL